MYTASLLFTLALVATTFALPIANPDYIATAVVTVSARRTSKMAYKLTRSRKMML